MNEFKLPHVEDLTTNSKLTGQLTENFKALEHEDHDDDSRLDQEIQDRKDTNARLQHQIDSLNTRLTTAEGNIIDLQTRTSSLEQQVKKLNDIIFGTQYINDTDEIQIDDSMKLGNDVEVNDTETVNDDEAKVRIPDHDALINEVN